MNVSYLMGIKDVTVLKENNFIIENIDDDYGITFSKDKEAFYENFIIQNLEKGYWNEYLSEQNRFVFIFKMNDGSIKRYVYNNENADEILSLCCEFAGCSFSSCMQMLKDNSFYASHYFNRLQLK